MRFALLPIDGKRIENGRRLVEVAYIGIDACFDDSFASRK
jgi:hypothetical protein